MNKMELVKFKQTLQHPQGKLNYLDKELSSYIFLQFNLSNVNFTTQLLETIFDKDLLLKFLRAILFGEKLDASDFAEEFAYDEFGEDSWEAYEYGYEEAYDYWMDEMGE